MDVKYQRNVRVFHNWACINYFKPRYFHQPQTREEIMQILNYARSHGEKVKILGSAHTPNSLICAADHLISLEKYSGIVDIDRDKGLVKVLAGTRYRELNTWLRERGFSLRNLSSISEQTIAGAMGTGTHATGANFGVLATEVVEIELITAQGQIIICNRTQNEDIFLAALCHLGALGVLCTITLRCEPAFCLKATQYPLHIDEFIRNLQTIIHSAEYVRYWYIPHTSYGVVWKANRAPFNEQQQNSAYSFWKKFQNFLSLIKSRLIGYYLYQFLLWISTFHYSITPYINRLYRYLLFNDTINVEDFSYKVISFALFGVWELLNTNHKLCAVFCWKGIQFRLPFQTICV